MEGLSQFLKLFPYAIPIVISMKNYINFEKDALSFLG